MLITVIKNELKNIMRDPMYIFFAVYPFVFGTIGYFTIDLINDDTWASMVVMLLIVMTSYIYGALTGFTLLDDKDDNVLLSLKITPINTKMYVFVKLMMSYVFGLVATIIVVYATGFLSESSFGFILLVATVSSLQAPFLALVVNSFAGNKIEGFVVMKATGITLILPAVAFWLTDWKEFFLIIGPGFWPARMIMMELLPTATYGIEYNFSIITYFIIGMAYNLLLTVLLFKLYSKKSNI
jgi:fluoroquinolone transport system permease protein